MLHIWRGNWILQWILSIGLPKRVCTKITDEFGKIWQIIATVGKNLLCQAHRYVLNNADEVLSYINDHMDYIRHINPTKSRREKKVVKGNKWTQ